MRISDWSSDVCSSDLQAQVLCASTAVAIVLLTQAWAAAARHPAAALPVPHLPLAAAPWAAATDAPPGWVPAFQGSDVTRSEERRVGKECVSPCRSRGSQYH